MKRAGKIAICLAGGLALNAGLHADDIYPDNPYTTIVTRNIFALEPIPTNPPDSEPVLAVTITPNGIMTLFGHLQVLFKAKTAARPGIPVKEDSYILAQGQRQDDIEVLKINERDGIITFSNHGIKQELPLANGTATSAYTGGYQGSANPAANGNAGNGYGVGARNGSFGTYGGRRGLANGISGGFGNGNGINGGGNSGADSGMNLRNFPTSTYQPNASATTSDVSTMTPEQQAAIIETERAQYEAEGNPMAKLFPPTILTPAVNADRGTPPPVP